MRICLVVHGFPPVERTGVENYTLGLCRAFARAGHHVEVFVPRKDAHTADLALRREDHGGYAVNWITNNHNPANPTEALHVHELEGSFAAFLERERPEIVHFQHLYKLGIGLVRVARDRGLPTVYTAHDYYPICHRYTLLRPDLTRCDVRNDSRACARCDLALSHLNALPGLGDYQGGVLRRQLSEADWATLQGIVGDRLEEVGVEPARLEDLVGEREELDRERSEAYRGIDLVLAPSRYLAGELERSGIDPARIRHQPYGFDNSDLAGLAPVRTDRSRPVRFGFLGGMSKHKGVHVLLEAFERLQGNAELAIWGDSSDREYVRLLRERCGQVGAQWRGAYERADLPEILPEIDALVVPSIWVENQPLVIHEGFSAGRPVITSDLGALPESVQDGVNGLLFRPGDPDDLARVMQRCIDEPRLIQELAGGIREIKGVDQEASELVALYEGLLAEREDTAPTDSLPPSLEEPVARFEELSALPSRELFVRVLSGLDDLRGAWADEVGGAGAVELLARGLGEGSEAQDRLREARNEITWLRTKKDELAGGREELMTLFQDLDRLLNETRAGSQKAAEHLESQGAYVRQKEAEAQAAHDRLRELEAVIAEKNRYIGEVERYLADKDRHLGEVQQYLADKDRHIGEVEQTLAEKDREIGEAEQRLSEQEQRIGKVEGDLEEAGQYIRHKEEEYREAEAELHRAAELSRIKDEELRRAKEEEARIEGMTRAVAQTGILAMRAQGRLLQRGLLPILERLHALIDPDGELQPPHEAAPFPELLAALDQAGKALEAVAAELEWRRGLQPELDWRRAEMAKIVALLDRHRVARRLVGFTPLGPELDSWRNAGSTGEGGAR